MKLTATINTPHPFGQSITPATLRQQFARLTSWEEKYRLLIQLGSQLTSLPEALKTPQIAIRGCEHRLWLGCQPFNDGRLHFYADSDSRIVKGLLAVLLTAIEGQTTSQLLTADNLAIFDTLNLRRQLSATRGQGLAALAQQITLYARLHHDHKAQIALLSDR